MAKRKGFLYSMQQTAKEAEKRRAAELRRQTQAAKAAERARTAYLRAQAEVAKAAEKERKEQEKEQARLYLEYQMAQVALQNEQIEYQVDQLNNLLSEALHTDPYFDPGSMKVEPEIPNFEPGDLENPSIPPTLAAYLPTEPSGLKKLLPGAREKHVRETAAARARYEADLDAHNRKETERQAHLAQAKAWHEAQVAEARRQPATRNADVDRFQQAYNAGDADAIVHYCKIVLNASSYPDDFPQHARLAYLPESKQLVVEYDLPPFDLVPEVSLYKYVRQKDEITATARPVTHRRALYGSTIAQVTLRTLHELFRADRAGHVETIVFNGYVDSVDLGTGRAIRPCLVTVRTTSDTFSQLDLSRVDPIACLKALNAGVSKSPAELAPVRPVLEFNMVDPRFIQERDVLSTLDQRPNLMELSPTEFESLITNLFQKMGLETRQTQASRDGGVDCVAYDPRPVLGGKVVIQAKRYKATVGVSAVRDLFGTVHNEGATKGILVTTSGYGKAAFEFAEGKPLQLLSGSELLYMLAEHAGMEAKIVVPEGWKDAQIE